jgi:transcriptional regulator with XRE-family HTH domain
VKSVTKADKVSLGKRLNAVRKEQQISANALSEKCSVDPVYIRMIERGSRTPSMSVFIDICNALRVSPGYLLADSMDLKSDEQIDGLCRQMKELTPRNLEMVTALIETALEKME